MSCDKGLETDLLLIDLGQGRNRLGGSALAQVCNAVGEHAPDADARLLTAFFAAIRRLRRDGMLLAYHDRADGGLFATVCEMAFAGHCGVSLNLDTVCYDPMMNDVDGMERRPEIVNGRLSDRVFAGLFSEELGAVVQIRRERSRPRDGRPARGGTERLHPLHRQPERRRRDPRLAQRQACCSARSARSCGASGPRPAIRIARLRDDADCAQQEFDQLLDAADPGLSLQASFDPADDVAAPFIRSGIRPRIAILREQGVNGQVEMAAAFERAGFAPYRRAHERPAARARRD